MISQAFIKTVKYTCNVHRSLGPRIYAPVLPFASFQSALVDGLPGAPIVLPANRPDPASAV